MKYAWLGCLFLGGLLTAGTSESDTNINTRYKVETVIVNGNGWTTDLGAGEDKKISTGLRKRIAGLIGDKLNPSALEEVAGQLRKEFHTRSVNHHVLRGATPEYVKVVFEVNDRNFHKDISVPKFLYNAKQGWSGAIEATGTVKHNSFTFGLVSDGDELAERFAGLVTRYESSGLGTDRVRARFAFESYHQQWNRSTLEALAAAPPETRELTSSAYRTRQNFEPSVTLAIAEPLTLSVGASFERFQNQYPAPHTEAANAVAATVRYHQRTEGSEFEHEVDAGYALRAGTKVLDSDFAYVRHSVALGYTLRYGHHALSDEFTAGRISGRAPLFDRFILGNSSTLRGWNKFEIDPLGGNRMVHNAVEYRYRILELFYDAGAIWDSGVTQATARHGAGLGLKFGAFALAVAFPVRSGRAEPVFMAGMNY